MMTIAGRGRQVLLVTVVALVVAVGGRPALQAAEKDVARAEAQIRAASEALREAVQKGDADRLVEMYTPDAQLIMAGKTVVGREAVRAHIAFAMAAGVRDFRLDEQELFVGDEIAVETGRATFGDAAGSKMATSRYMTLWKRIDGRWRIHRDISVPAPGGAPTQAAQRPATFAVKQVDAYTAVVLPMTGAYAQHGDGIARLAIAVGSSVTGPPFGRYYNSPESVAEAELRWEIGFPVTANVAASAPFERRAFPAETVAFAVVAGPHEGSRPWPQLVEWAVAQGYEITGPAMEIWMDGPKTEMRISVRKPGSK
jgi:AraC family transcriptional regulator